jgi:hypothetical protein
MYFSNGTVFKGNWYEGNKIDEDLKVIKNSPSPKIKSSPKALNEEGKASKVLNEEFKSRQSKKKNNQLL